MKKILFLLLLISTAINAQVATGNEAYFDYGIQVAPSALQIPSTVPYLGTFGADGTMGRVTPNSNIITNQSTVSGATTTDALNTLKSSIPVVYSTVVYVNNANPNAATIFDDVNPPVLNDNSLKANVNNLYVGTDSSGWIYNTSTVNYTSKIIPSASNFYLSGTTTDAGNDKTSPIYRSGGIALKSSTAPVIGKLEVFTGTSVRTTDMLALPFGSLSFGNDNVSMAAPSLISKSNDDIGMSLISGTNNTNVTDMRFNVRENDNTDFSTLTSTAFSFSRFSTPLVDILRNGNTGFGTSAPIAKVHANGTDLNTGYFLTKAGASIGVVGAESTWIGTGTSNNFVLASYGSNSLILGTSGSSRIDINNLGVVKVSNLSGSGTRQVVADASGNLSATDAAPTSGSYTPTLINTLNVSGATLSNATYTRVGNIVTVNVSFTVTATLANTLSQVKVSLPVTRTPATTVRVGNLTTVEAVTSSFNSGVVDVSSTTEATLYFKSISAANYTIGASFQYSVI